MKATDWGMFRKPIKKGEKSKDRKYNKRLCFYPDSLFKYSNCNLTIKSFCFIFSFWGGSPESDKEDAQEQQDDIAFVVYKKRGTNSFLTMYVI